MSTAVAVVDAQSPAVVSEINAEHRACHASYATALEHAIVCGNLLHKVHLQVHHGNWGKWVEENFEGSQRTADGYIQLAIAHEQDPHLLEEVDSISAAFSAITRRASGQHDESLEEHDVVDAEVVPDPVYELTLAQLTSLARKRWHRPPDEKEVLAWLKDTGLA